MTNTATAVPPLRGDETALFRQHARPLVRAVGRAVNTSDAIVEDACQFAWTQFLRRQPDREHLFAWLRTTAIREAWDLSARERAHSLDIAMGERGDDGTLADHLTGAVSLELQIEARDALAALAELRPRHRHTLSRLVAGLSHVEIQRECGLSATQVTRHITRARTTLRA